MQTTEGVPNDQNDVYYNQNLRFSLSSMFAFVLVAAPVKTDAPTSEKYRVQSN